MFQAKDHTQVRVGLRRPLLNTHRSMQETPMCARPRARPQVGLPISMRRPAHSELTSLMMTPPDPQTDSNLGLKQASRKPHPCSTSSPDQDPGCMHRLREVTGHSAGGIAKRKYPHEGAQHCTRFTDSLWHQEELTPGHWT